jgi:hypothetical protein
MPKEWILNQANMRWGLTKKTRVGPVSELIRKCSSKSIKEWESYYFKNVYSKQHLEELGRRLYIKITEVCQAEIESIEEEDCINFITNLVINRTYDGYQSEIQTIYGQLEEALGIIIEPAPDEWDRGYNVDFFIKVKDQYIGLQIKPAGYAYIIPAIAASVPETAIEALKKNPNITNVEFDSEVYALDDELDNSW